jgi:hypothetical protein
MAADLGAIIIDDRHVAQGELDQALKDLLACAANCDMTSSADMNRLRDAEYQKLERHLRVILGSARDQGSNWWDGS